MAIRYTEESQIPEAEKADFVPFKEGDVEVFVHKEFADAKKEQYKLKGDVTRLTESTDSMKTKLDELGTAERARAEAAEEERLKGLTATQRMQEQIDSLKQANDETKTQFEQRLKAEQDKANSATREATIADVATAATDKNKTILKRMAAQDLEVQDDGSIIVLDESGKATAQTVEDYKASLADRYPSLVSAVQSQGGDARGGARNTQHGKGYGSNIPGFNQLPKN